MAVILTAIIAFRMVDTRLWAALQRASGGTWAGCVYDADRIIDALNGAR